MYLDKAKERFQAMLFELNQVEKVTPVTHEKIQRLENFFGFKIPQAYREFLEWMGEDGDDFMATESFWIGQIQTNQEEALYLLNSGECSDLLPSDAIIFYMHCGYTFYFMTASNGDNPPIHRYVEDELSDRIEWDIYKNLQEFIIVQIDASLHFHRKMNQPKY